MELFDDYIKARSHTNEQGLNVISVNEVMGAWREYMAPLIRAYQDSYGDLEYLGIECKNFLNKMKLV